MSSKLAKLTNVAMVAGTALGLLGAAVPPAAADWLVTREGGRVETRGSWEVKGRLVVFQAPDGSLASVRAADVDLEASRRATEEARKGAASPAAPAPAVRKKSVHSFTDKDFRQAVPQPAAAAEEPAVAAEQKGEKAAPAQAIQVSTWDRSSDPDAGYVVITGVVRNVSQSSATNIRLAVLLEDENGSLLLSSQADVTASALMPGEQAGFRAAFPGVFAFSNVKFESESLNLRLGSSGEAAPVPAGR